MPTLVEKGRFCFSLPDLKQGMDKARVPVILNKEVTPQLVKEVQPDVVIVATGATPKSLDVPGVDRKNVVQAVDVIRSTVKVGNNVVVVGGRMLGMETADLLSEQGKNVSVITLKNMGENGRPLPRMLVTTMLRSLVKHGVFLYPHCPVIQITDDGIYVDMNGDLLFLEADTIVLAVGARPLNNLVTELKGMVPEIYAIGDCVEPRDALYAIREGADIGRKI